MANWIVVDEWWHRLLQNGEPAVAQIRPKQIRQVSQFVGEVFLAMNHKADARAARQVEFSGVGQPGQSSVIVRYLLPLYESKILIRVKILL